MKKEELKKRFKARKIDLKNSYAFRNLPKRISFIIHLAAVSSLKKSKRGLLKKCNINGTKNLAEFATQQGVKKIIFASSMSIYGQVKAKTVDENTKIIRPDIYGRSKLLGETFLKTPIFLVLPFVFQAF